MADLSTMTDEELDAIISGKDVTQAPPGKGAAVLAERNAAVGEKVARASPDYTQGMSTLDLMRAGAGADINKLLQGAKHGAQILFAPSDPEAKKALYEQIAQERKETADINKQLMMNPASVAGSFLAQAAPAVAGPARLPAQIGMEMVRGAIEDVPGAPTSTASELASRGMQAGERGAVTGVVGKGVQAAGKTIGAATGQFTERGKEAMALRDEAAQKLGIDLSMGELDPNSWLGIFSRRNPKYGEHLEEQARKLASSMESSKQIPGMVSGTTETKVMPGEGLRQSIVQAGKKIEQAGSDRWQALDQYVTTNNLPQVAPSNLLPIVDNIGASMTKVKTVNGVPKYQSNEVFDRVADYGEQEANWLKMMASSPVNIRTLSFDSIDSIRKAVGKAFARAERDMAAPNPTQDTRMARNELRKMYSALNQDLEAWGTTNAGTKEAKAMFDEANAFWRERVVPDVIMNKLARKSQTGEIGAKPRGYESAEQLYTDILGKGGQERVARLAATLSPKAKAEIDVLRTLENAAPRPTDGGLASLALMRAAAGHPLGYGMGSVLPRAPGIQWAGRSRPVQALHFAEDVFEGAPAGRISLDLAPRAAYGMAQYPIGAGVEWERKLRGSQGR